MTAEHKYEMTISLQIVEHLGLNLYSNTSAVISEAVQMRGMQMPKQSRLLWKKIVSQSRMMAVAWILMISITST